MLVSTFPMPEEKYKLLTYRRKTMEANNGLFLSEILFIYIILIYIVKICNSSAILREIIRLYVNIL